MQVHKLLCVQQDLFLDQPWVHYGKILSVLGYHIIIRNKIESCRTNKNKKMHQKLVGNKTNTAKSNKNKTKLKILVIEGHKNNPKTVFLRRNINWSPRKQTHRLTIHISKSTTTNHKRNNPIVRNLGHCNNTQLINNRHPKPNLYLNNT